MILGGQVFAVVTGLASGANEPVGWRCALVLGSLVIYSLAIIEVGVGEVLLCIFTQPPNIHIMVAHINCFSSDNCHFQLHYVKQAYSVS
jgi:hypothetical protein